MNSNGEIREKAWRLLWDGKWFGRLLLGAILLSLCSQIVNSLLNGMLNNLGVFNLSAFAEAIERHLASRAPMPEFTSDMLMQLASSTVLTLFFAFIMGGIVAYGNSVLILRAADEKPENCLKAAFGGFGMPLGLASLAFRLFLVYVFWFLVSVVPVAALSWVVSVLMPSALDSEMAGKVLYSLAAVIGLAIVFAVCSIPFYRYRYLFRVKADNPDWSAGRCLAECAALTDGYKWRCFLHDCSYWKILLAVLLLMLVCTGAMCVALIPEARQLVPAGVRMGVASACGVIGLFSNFAMVGVVVIAAFYIGVGQSLLYRDIQRERQRDGLASPAMA